MGQLGHGTASPAAAHSRISFRSSPLPPCLGTWTSSQSTPRQITALASERVVAVEAGFIHALALAGTASPSLSLSLSLPCRRLSPPRCVPPHLSALLPPSTLLPPSSLPCLFPPSRLPPRRCLSRRPSRHTRASTPLSSLWPLALAESGAVYAWGAGGDGRLCHGSDEHLSTPRRIEALAGRHEIVI